MNAQSEQIELEQEVAAIRAWAEGRTIYIELHDGRIIGFPSDRFARLNSASEDALKEVSVEVNGYALRWNNIDEDLTVNGILAGRFQLPPQDATA